MSNEGATGECEYLNEALQNSSRNRWHDSATHAGPPFSRILRGRWEGSLSGVVKEFHRVLDGLGIEGHGVELSRGVGNSDALRGGAERLFENVDSQATPGRSCGGDDLLDLGRPLEGEGGGRGVEDAEVAAIRGESHEGDIQLNDWGVEPIVIQRMVIRDGLEKTNQK